MTTRVTGTAGNAGSPARDTRNEDAKREILKRIRDAQQLSEVPEHVEIVREYRTTSDLPGEELHELLVDRLIDYKADVVETTEATLGEDIVRADGTLDARTLNRLTTESSTARTRMYEIVSPAVRDEANRRAREIGEDSVLVVDLALLAETGSGQDFDQVLAVSAPAEVRVARLMESHDMTRERAWALIDEEAADEERAEIADTVIENDGSLEDLQEAVRAYWEAKIQPQLEAARGERV